MDGGTAQPSAEHLDENLRDLQERLRRGRYQAAPVERVWIEQDDGGQRPSGTPACENKMVQRAGAMLVAAVYAPDCSDGSDGFRPGRSPHKARHELRQRCLTEGSGGSVEAEGRGYCDRIARTRLREGVRQRSTDGSRRRLMGQGLRAGGNTAL